MPKVLHRFAVENCEQSGTNPTATLIERAVESVIANSTAATATPATPTTDKQGVIETATAEKGANVEEAQRLTAKQQDLLDMEMDKEHWLKYL